MSDTASAAAAPAGNSQSTDAPAAAPAATTTAPADTSATAAAPVVSGEAPTAAEAPAEAKPETPAAKAPEKYDFKALESNVDPSVLGKFEGIARELDLSQDQAAKLLADLAPEVSNAQKAKNDQMVQGWMESAKTDKEFGGDKLGENLAIAKKGLEAVASPELIQMLDKSGLGNHPEVIRAFLKVGQKISQGSFVPASQPVSQAGNASSKLYPSMNR